MIILHGDTNIEYTKNGIACALGFFDGVHIGHQKLIKTLIENSKKNHLKSMIFTFEEHPKNFLGNKEAVKLITDNNIKAQIFNDMEVDIVNFYKINKEFLCYEPENFLEQILIKYYNVKFITAGFNFRFGNLGRGNNKTLTDFCNKYSIKQNIIEPVIINDIVVSSTIIRDYIKNGNIKAANYLLGRSFKISGNVIYGKRRGHQIGFPTVNLGLKYNNIIPQNGVYITKVYVNNCVKLGVTNIGYNPTFSNNYISIETHIIDFNQYIYGEEITLEFYDKLREEKHFNSIIDLSNQIRDDIRFVKAYFNVD